jgi:hypothetical protein
VKPPPGPYASAPRTLLALVVIGLVVAAPAVLLETVGGPVPGDALTERISADGVTGTRRVPAGFVVELVGCLLWLAWAVTFAALVLELAGLVRRRAPGYVDVLRPIQQFHRGTIEQLRQGLRGRRPEVLSADQLLLRTAVPTFVLPATAEAPVPKDDRLAYEVTGFYTGEGQRVERETLWTIARDQLGDPQRWRELAEINRSLLESHGRSVTDPGWPEPGWVLLLPRSDQ